MTQKTSLGVVVPCFNEEHNVDYFESEVGQFLPYLRENFPHIEVQFYVVENNSTDGTRVKLNSLMSRQKNLSIVDCSAQGYGAALKFGFETAKKNDYVSFLDFDNTYPMKSIPDLLTELQKKELDLVYGARLHQQSEIDPIRKAGNRLYVILLKCFIGSELSDVCSGMRVFKSKHVDSILTLKADDLSFSIQLTSYAILKKWKIGELPISYRKRIGESKLSLLKDGVLFLLVAMKAGLLRKV